MEAILKLAGPALINFVKNYAADNFKSTPDEPQPDIDPSETVKHLQEFLNKALSLNPPLDVDGWLGPLTEAAIEQAIAQLKAYGVGV